MYSSALVPTRAAEQRFRKLHQNNLISSSRSWEAFYFHPLLCVTFPPIQHVTEAVPSKGSTKPKLQEIPA